MEKQPQKKSIRGRQPDGSPHPVDLHVGRRMRLRRNLLGISQETLAHKLGLTFQQVQKYERGLNRISSSRLFDISKVLNVRVSYFFDEMDEDVSAGSPTMPLPIRCFAKRRLRWLMLLTKSKIRVCIGLFIIWC